MTVARSHLVLQLRLPDDALLLSTRRFDLCLLISLLYPYPLQCISMLSWYCELDAWGAKLVRLGKKPDSVPHPLSGMYRKGKYEGDSMFNKLGNLLGSSAGTAAVGSVAGALGGKLPGFGFG